jgi:tetratricopeptide (TPR) repeat protein
VRIRLASRAAAAGLCLALAAASLRAAPFVPERDDVVLDVLPEAARPAARELRAATRRLGSEPRDLELATRLSWRMIELGRAESDPRYYGRAEGMLRPWWGLERPPPEVLLLRATLRQQRHEFDAALEDLDRVLASDPRRAQAWLTRAVILLVRAEIEQARRSCLALLPLGRALAGVTCLAQVESLAGGAERSARMLRRALDAAPGWTREERVFALSGLAEIAERLGWSDAVERALGEALALAPRDAGLLAARSDFLLDADRPREVVTLLRGETRVDGLLLRLALAAQRLQAEDFPLLRAELEARFAAARARGDRLHLAEESRYTLHCLGDAREALRLALSNWEVQREPTDARAVLEAALAARDPRAADPVLRLMRRTGLEDARLAPLVAKLGAAP